MEFTGERYLPNQHGEIRLEHFHRYAIVLDVVKDKDILDVACGEGYGSFMLADTARSVVGVDISDEATRHAASYYIKPNLSYCQGSAIDLNFPDASFDVVISFETIEHLAEQAEMIKEIRRVLRPNGVLVISSPNRPIYTVESGEHNEFHVKELDFQEFDRLLRSQFFLIEYFGQRLSIGSVVQQLQRTPSTAQVWSDDGQHLRQHAATLADPIYFIAICGACDVCLPQIEMSVLYPEALDLLKHYVGFAKWAKTLDSTLAKRDEQISEINQILAERDEQISETNQILAERDEQISEINQILAERDEQISEINQILAARDEQISEINQILAERDEQISEINQILAARDEQISEINQILAERDGLVERHNQAVAERDAKIASLDKLIKAAELPYTVLLNSRSWKITRPLREGRRWLLHPKQQLYRYATYALNFAKINHHRIPLSYVSKRNLYRYLCMHFPALSGLAAGKPVAHPGALDASRALNAEQAAKFVVDNTPAFARLQSHTVGQPLVSVIIPVYGKVDFTLRCIASIANHLPESSLEIIVVDDYSPDDSFDILSRVEGIRLLRNQQNEGFIRSCNRGASQARGDYLYFLNNDTQVTHGWLDELLRTFHEFSGTGLAGSKLLYPDGRLQEAGGIIWQDGSAWNFGRSQDQLLPVYNYAREVDYCSGASIMVPKALFDELGGFDEYYLPAYCEDSDLALKIRDKGYRVIYQPLSTVIHFEGITSGTDTTQGAKAYQVENSKKLLARWQQRLAEHQAPGTDVDAAKDRSATRRVLVLDHCTPTPNQDAGSVTVFNLLLLLRDMDFQVTFIPEDNLLYMPEYTTALQRAGIEVLYAPYITSVEQHLKEYGDRYNLAFLFRPGVVDRHLKVIRRCCPNAKVLFHTVDLHFLRMSREAELQSDRAKKKAADEMQQLELAAIGSADASIVHSTAELEILRPLVPEAKLHVFPLIMDVQGARKTYQERRDIVFIGGYQHPPNVDAVKYFVEEVMPLLRTELQGVRFYAVGSKPPDDIKALATDDIIVTGYVENLTSLLDKMRVSVAPLRYGAGIKGKIGAAMSVGLPVVATSLAAEGMSLTDGENILVADGAEALADTLARIYNDEALWIRINKNGLAFAEQAWSAGAAWKNLAEILCDLGIKIQQSKYDLVLHEGK